MNESSANIEFRNVPADWVLKEFGQVASLKSGGSAPQGNEYFKDGKYPFVRVQHFNGTEKYLTRWDLITDKAVKDCRLKLFKKEIILFPKSGASIMLEKRAKLPFDAYVVGHLCCVEPKGVENDFLFYLLKYVKFAHTIDGSTLPYLNLNHLAKRLIPVPPLHEQRCIAYMLATVQTAIEQQARLIALTRELKSALMHKLFTEGLCGEKQKETEIGLVPESWEQLRLEKTGDVIYGIQAAVANNLKPIGMKILTNKNITLDGQIVLDDINYFELKTKRHFETILKKGDILFNWRSGSKEHIGKTAYFNLDGEYTHSSFILRIRPNENINGRFLFWYLYFLRASAYFLQKHDVSSVNATFNKSAVDALSVFLPSKDEQEKIASILDAIDEKITLLKQKRDFQEELFRTLLHQLMTGQTRVNEIDLPGFS